MPFAAAHDVTSEMAELLRAGAADDLGLICSPGSVRKNYPVLQEAERLGYIRFLDIERPWITEAGRAAIGAPTEAESDRARRIAIFSAARARQPLKPAKRADPRTDFDYRSYRKMGYVCVLAVKLPDDRENPQSIKVTRPGSTEPHYLGPRNSIIMQESEGRFVLALIPKWLQKRIFLPTWSRTISDDGDWTDDERATWDRLAQVCMSINSRIQNANRKAPDKRRYGETA